MAKENKKQETAKKEIALTSENIKDVVRNGNLVDMTLTQRVQDEIKKEQDDRKAEELKRAVMKASYRRNCALFQIRARRREERITLEKLKQSEVLLDLLAGFALTSDKCEKHGGKDGKLTVNGKEYVVNDNDPTWVPATITPIEYKTRDEQLAKDIEKAISESKKEYDKDIAELESQYSDYFIWSWRW